MGDLVMMALQRELARLVIGVALLVVALCVPVVLGLLWLLGALS